MKKIFILCLTVFMTASVLCQIKKVETKVNKNRFDLGGYFNYEFDTADIPVATTAFTLPYVKYELETEQEGNNLFYLDGDLSYNMSKMTVDGEAPEGADQFGSVLYLHLNPRFKYYFTEEFFKKFGGGKKKETVSDDTWNDWADAEEPVEKSEGKWFLTLGLPVTYEMITPQYEDADGVTSTFIDASLKLGYDTKKIDIVKKTPWGKFEKGWSAYGLFDYRLTETYYDEDSETKPIAMGIGGDYNYELDSFIADATVKGFMTLKYQMADEAVMMIPKNAANLGWPYVGKSMNMRYGVEYAQDITDFLNVNATMAYLSMQLLDDPEGDSQNFLEMFGRVNFYLPQMPEVNIWGGISWTGHLPEELDYVPDFDFAIGAEYRFDVIAFKNRPKTEKAKEEETEEDYEW